MKKILEQNSWPVFTPLLWVIPLLTYWSSVKLELVFVPIVFCWALLLVYLLEKDHRYLGSVLSHYERVADAYPRFIGLSVMFMLLFAYIFCFLSLGLIAEQVVRFIFDLPNTLLVKSALVLIFYGLALLPFALPKRSLFLLHFLIFVFTAVWAWYALQQGLRTHLWVAWPDPTKTELISIVPILLAVALPLVLHYNQLETSPFAFYEVREAKSSFPFKAVILALTFGLILVFSLFLPLLFSDGDLAVKINFLPIIFASYINIFYAKLVSLIFLALVWLMALQLFKFIKADFKILFTLDHRYNSSRFSAHFAFFQGYRWMLLFLISVPNIVAIVYNRWDFPTLIGLAGQFFFLFAVLFGVVTMFQKRTGYVYSPLSLLFLALSAALGFFLYPGIFLPGSMLFLGATIDLALLIRSKETKEPLRYQRKRRWWRKIFFFLR